MNRKRFERVSDWSLFFLFFAFYALVACVVQWFILPYVFPQWHAGHGLLVGGDWLRYHPLAVELAEKVHAQGWTAWELYPGRQFPAGVAGAVYALTVPEPWTLIPLNAALQATATLVLLWIVRLFGVSRRFSFYAVLPFVIYPSAALWYTQILKDGYTVTGFLLVLYGWLLMAHPSTWQRIRSLCNPLLLIGCGILLMWLARAYMLQMLQGIGIAISILLTAAYFYGAIRRHLSWPRAAVAMSVAWGVLLLFSVYTFSPSKSFSVDIADTQQNSRQLDWIPTPALGSSIDEVFYNLALVRESSRNTNEGTPGIDTDIAFHSALDVLSYLPRAFQIALLAPWPTQWSETGSSTATTWMRRVAGFEMLGLYLGFLVLPAIMLKWRRRMELWMIVCICVGMAVIYALAVTNIGAIYRVRYAFVMTLATLGFGYLLERLSAWRQTRKSAK